MPTKDTKETTKKEEPKMPKGKYIETIGRRKTSTARVRLYKKGNGVIFVNGEKMSNYFVSSDASIVKQPLKLTNHLRDMDFTIVVSGGGKKAQAEAARHGISHALIETDAELKPAIKAKGWTTRDARRKERKKPGLKKARRAPQWSKR
jgi:small subunit ribosomal protein S9